MDRRTPWGSLRPRVRLGRRFEALVARVVADYAAVADQAGNAAWIATLDGVRAGSILCVDAGGRNGQKLRLLLVEPFARGHWIGARLVDECISFARRAGFHELVLWTNEPLRYARPVDTGNVLLTLARVWLTLETGEMAAKDVAADWAIARLPEGTGDALRRARAEYVGQAQADERIRGRGDGRSPRGRGCYARVDRGDTIRGRVTLPRGRRSWFVLSWVCD